MKEEALFYSIGKTIEGAVKSQMFGRACFKIGGKAFMCFLEDAVICKLADDVRGEALRLGGAQLFDPSGRGRPWKQWVQIPFGHSSKWEKYANAAAEYVEASQDE